MSVRIRLFKGDKSVKITLSKKKIVLCFHESGKGLRKGRREAMWTVLRLYKVRGNML